MGVSIDDPAIRSIKVGMTVPEAVDVGASDDFALKISARLKATIGLFKPQHSKNKLFDPDQF
jgi:hypothetical protein